MNKRNKKGFIAGSMIDVYAYLFFVLVILFFYILFHFTKATVISDINNKVEDTSTEYLLNNYLNTPISDHETMSDLISKYYLAEYINQDSTLAASYKILFEDETEKILQGSKYTFNNHNTFWQIELSHPDGSTFLLMPFLMAHGFVVNDCTAIVPIQGLYDTPLFVKMKQWRD